MFTFAIRSNATNESEVDNETKNSAHSYQIDSQVA